MVMASHGRLYEEVNRLLHQLLEHRKSQLGLGPQDRLEPEQFFPVDIQLLLGLSGWTVTSVSMVGHTSSLEELGAKSIRAENTIMVSTALQEDAKRYTLAHELAHVVLHDQIPDCYAGNRPRMLSMLDASKRKRWMQYSDIEMEAEAFARELLMPERAVRRHFRKVFGVDRFRISSHYAQEYAPRAHKTQPVDPRAVADETARRSTSSAASMVEFFGVSPRAMRRRLVELRLVY